MTTMPQRRSDLTVSELGGESVIFDPTSNVAHKVTAPAQAVWLECDGTSSVKDVAYRLSMPVIDVQAACDELIDAKLAKANGFSRRTVLQGGAVAGALFVSTVVIPKAAAAVSAPGGGPGGGTQAGNPTFTYTSTFEANEIEEDFCLVTIFISNLPPGTYTAIQTDERGNTSDLGQFTSTSLQEVWDTYNDNQPTGSSWTVQVFDAANQKFGPPSQTITAQC